MILRTRTAAILVIALAGLGLAGCAPGVFDDAEPTQSQPTAPPVESDTPVTVTPTAEPTTAPVGGGEDLTTPCEQVFTVDDLYAFSPNFAAAADPMQALPPALVKVVEYGGVVCAYQHTGSSDVLFVGVAKPDEAARAEVEAAGTFSQDGDLGTASRLTDVGLVVVSSEYFSAEADAQATLDAAAAHLS